ncbi:MAG: hypothetical protein DWQ07_13410 [Chloroflexi bacterium]|nr:MAG: hypothetical protein DWQ07_13410 [Chloroflexota bacterium]MBL1196766.1 hypothetical protein [Chloroflexota bacterium]NOH14060.1 hypothetical protein [Chloroflexota bacterium]
MIRHLAGLAEVVDDVGKAVSFYRDVLGLPVKHEEGAEYVEVEIEGILHYGIWSRRAAAQAIYGDPEASDQIELGYLLGFEVDSVEKSSQHIKSKSSLIQPPKEEPWGQRTSRFEMPSGQLAEIAETPWARKITRSMETDPPPKEQP